MSVLLFTIFVWLGGLAAGLLGALTGLGGGVVIVPLLTLIFGVDIHCALYACQAAVGPLWSGQTGPSSAFRRRQARDRGGRGQVPSNSLGAGKGESPLSIRDIDRFWVRQERKGRAEKLRRVLQAVGGESCLGEHVTFDVLGDRPRGRAFTLGRGSAKYVKLTIEKGQGFRPSVGPSKMCFFSRADR